MARNVAEQASPPPAGRPKEPSARSVEDLKKFLTHVEGDRQVAAHVVAAYSGLRRGELLGLRWRDVDLERGTLSSVQTVISVDYKVLFSRPKTAAGRRSEGLAPEQWSFSRAIDPTG